MESKEESSPNSDEECVTRAHEDTSKDPTLGPSDEQETKVQPSTSTEQLSSSQRRRMRKKKFETPAENQEIWRQFYNLRRERPGHVTPSELLDEVAVDKNIDQRLDGWRLTLACDQMDSLSDIETRNVELLSSMLIRYEAVFGLDKSDDSEEDDDDDEEEDDEELKAAVDDTRPLFKEIIEQSKMVRDTMQMARLRTRRLLKHKPPVSSIVRDAITDVNQRRKDEECN